MIIALRGVRFAPLFEEKRCASKNTKAANERGCRVIPESKEGRVLKMLEFDEFKQELDKYKGSLAELGESL